MARSSISSGALFRFHDANSHDNHQNNNLHQNARRYQTISIPATAYGHTTNSPGAVAGIILAVVAGTLLVVYLIYFTFIYPRRRRTAVPRDDPDMVEVEEELDYGPYDRRQRRGGRRREEEETADFVDVIEEESSVGGRRPPPRRERPRRAPAGGRKGGGGWWWGGGGGGGGSSVSRSSVDSRDRGNTVEVMEEVDPPAPEPPRMKRTRKPRRHGGGGGGRRRGDDPFGID